MKNYLNLILLLLTVAYSTAQDVYTFERIMKAEGARTTNMLTFTDILPVDLPHRQEVMSINLSNDSARVFVEKGNKYVQFSKEDFNEAEEVSIKTTVKLYANDLFYAKKRVQKVVQGKDLSAYLKNEEYLQMEDKTIQSIADSIIGTEEETVVRQVFEVVVEHLEYDNEAAENQGPVAALTCGKGDCTEYAELMVALCRLKNIPARLVLGVIAQDGKNDSKNPRHHWVEVYFKQYGWVAFDPTQTDNKAGGTSFEKMPNHYIYYSYDRQDDLIGWKGKGHVKGEDISYFFKAKNTNKRFRDLYESASVAFTQADMSDHYLIYPPSDLPFYLIPHYGLGNIITHQYIKDFNIKKMMMTTQRDDKTISIVHTFSETGQSTGFINQAKGRNQQYIQKIKYDLKGLKKERIKTTINEVGDTTIEKLIYEYDNEALVSIKKCESDCAPEKAILLYQIERPEAQKVKVKLLDKQGQLTREKLYHFDAEGRLSTCLVMAHGDTIYLNWTYTDGVINYHKQGKLVKPYFKTREEYDSENLLKNLYVDEYREYRNFNLIINTKNKYRYNKKQQLTKISSRSQHTEILSEKPPHKTKSEYEELYKYSKNGLLKKYLHLSRGRRTSLTAYDYEFY